MFHNMITPSNVAFVSDIILVWFGVVTGLLTKNFYLKGLSTSESKYVEYLMKIKNYKHYAYISVIFHIVTNIFMTIVCMAILSSLNITNTWYKLILGLFSGMFGFDVIRIVANVSDKGDSFSSIFFKVIKSFFTNGINIKVKLDSSEDKIDVSGKNMVDIEEKIASTVKNIIEKEKSDNK